MAAIFLQATIILAANELTDYKGYKNNGEGVIGYVVASYYVIICFSTVGYGDIYPNIWQTRVLMIVVLITNLTVLSSFLSKFTELLFMRSSYDREYQFNDHLVIFGDFPDYFLADFLSELVEIDRGRLLIQSKTEQKDRENIKVVIVNP